MTSDGATLLKRFYTVFRTPQIHEGEFKVEDIERLLMNAKEEVPDLLEGVHQGQAILTRYRSKNEDAINELVPWPPRL